MDQSPNREGEEHGEGHIHQHFSYHQQHQPVSAVQGSYHFTLSSSSRDHGSPSHSHPHTRDWLATTQPLAEDKSNCFRSSYNFMEENEEDENEVRRRLEHQQTSSSSHLDSHSSHHSQTLAAVEQIEKEHMFDKAVTPSDVGKLNRLVIPKQHAERYFPLDSSANEKGLHLNFEDRTRKLWRFRYCYWTSSQSYVMTKGWSRFVKEKKLDAGDIVSFQRGVGEAFRDRLFIDWRRRPSNPLLFHHEPSLIIPSLSLPHQYFPFHQGKRSVPWAASASTPLYLRPLAQLTSGHHFPQHNFNNLQSQSHHYNQYHHQQQQLQQDLRGNFQSSPLYNNNNGFISHPYGAAAVGSSSQTVVYLKSSADESPGSGDHGMKSMVFDSAPAVPPPKAEGKKLRLFGVDMECDNLPNTDHDGFENFSSSPIPAMVTSPPDSLHFRNDNDTSDPNKRSQRNMSLNLSF